MAAPITHDQPEVINYLNKIVYLQLILMDGNSRALFKKKPRKQFIQRFKTEVRESSSKSNSQNKHKMYSSISPKQNKHSLQRKTPLRTCNHNNNLTSQYSSTQPHKQKIKLLPSSQYQTTHRKDKNTISSEVNTQNDPFNAILSNIFESIQFRKQASDTLSSENKENESDLLAVQKGVIISGILFENARKLRLLNEFQQQSKAIENTVKQMILKLRKKYQQQLSITIQNKATKIKFDGLKQKLVKDELTQVLSKHPLANAQIKTVRNPITTNQNRNCNDNSISTMFKKKNGHSSCRALSSLASFKIENEDKNKTQQIKMQQLYQTESVKSPLSSEHPPDTPSHREQNNFLTIYHDLWKEEDLQIQSPDSQSKRSLLNDVITAVNSKFNRKAKNRQ